MLNLNICGIVVVGFLNFWFAHANMGQGIDKIKVEMPCPPV
jgi:hypothetical protein